MSETYFFKHDYFARSSKKLSPLVEEYGFEGYGIYWLIVEILHEEETSEIEYSEKSLRRICGKKSDYTRFKQISDDCIELYELFQIQDGKLSCKRVAENKD